MDQMQGELGATPSRDALDQSKEQLKQVGSHAYERAIGRVDSYKGDLLGKVHGFADALEQMAEGTDGKQGYEAVVRRASGWVRQLASSIEDKSTEELIGTARDQLRSHPGAVVASLAALGFIGARLLRK